MTTIKYSALGDTRKAPRKVLREGRMRIGHTDRARPVTLVRVGAGWEPAGSMARIVDGYYAVRYDIDGAAHGARYRIGDSALAEAHFDRLAATGAGLPD